MYVYIYACNQRLDIERPPGRCRKSSWGLGFVWILGAAMRHLAERLLSSLRVSYFLDLPVRRKNMN